MEIKKTEHEQQSNLIWISLYSRLVLRDLAVPVSTCSSSVILRRRSSGCSGLGCMVVQKRMHTIRPSLLLFQQHTQRSFLTHWRCVHTTFAMFYCQRKTSTIKRSIIYIYIYIYQHFSNTEGSKSLKAISCRFKNNQEGLTWGAGATSWLLVG